jgi:hypothetical protein
MRSIGSAWAIEGLVEVVRTAKVARWVEVDREEELDPLPDGIGPVP